MVYLPPLSIPSEMGWELSSSQEPIHPSIPLDVVFFCFRLGSDFIAIPDANVCGTLKSGTDKAL